MCILALKLKARAVFACEEHHTIHNVLALPKEHGTRVDHTRVKMSKQFISRRNLIASQSQLNSLFIILRSTLKIKAHSYDTLRPEHGNLVYKHRSWTHTQCSMSCNDVMICIFHITQILQHTRKL